MIKLATHDDAEHIRALIVSEPDFCEDVGLITRGYIEKLIHNCTVYVGEYGVFIADEITNAMCRVHPLWNGEGAQVAMNTFLKELPYNVACGFVPSNRTKVTMFFERCGFNKVGTFSRSILLNDEFQDQTVYEKDLSCL